MIRRITGRFVAILATAALVLSLGVGTALAGETTGNGESLKLDDPGKWGTWLHARSFCAFSGLNDEVTPQEPGRVQNWGSIPKAVRDQIAQVGFHPGKACNPNVGPPPEP